jgi:hypothetical protein
MRSESTMAGSIDPVDVIRIGRTGSRGHRAGCDELTCSTGAAVRSLRPDLRSYWINSHQPHASPSVSKQPTRS